MHPVMTRGHLPTLGHLIAAACAAHLVLAPAMAATGEDRRGDAPVVPKIGAPQYFGDWAVGCDNVLRCEATSLQPAQSLPEPVLVQIARDGGGGGTLVLRVRGLDPLPAPLMLIVDGGKPVRLVPAGGTDAELRDGEALRALRAMVVARTVELRAKKAKAPLASVSLDGLGQVFAFMDARQGRRGTVGALAAPGKAMDSTVPPAPAAPRIAHPVAPDADSGIPLSAAETERARALARCDASQHAAGRSELYPLDARAALVLLPCGPGADNDSAVPLIVRRVGGERAFAIAAFDHEPGFTGAPGMPPLVVNALWDARRGILSSLAKGSPAGDCGASEDYVWDGTMFRLVEARAMQLCRGAWDWIRLWTAAPVAKAAATATE